MSKLDSDVEALIVQQYKAKLMDGAPVYWYPKTWLAFILCGRPAGTHGFLNVGAIGNRRSGNSSSEAIDVDSLVTLANSSSKKVRTTAKEFLVQKKDGVHSSPSTEDDVKYISSNTSPSRLVPHRVIDVRYISDKQKKVDEPEDVISKCQKLSSVYHSLIEDMTEQLKCTPDDVNLQEEINTVRAKKIKLLKLQSTEMELKYGF